MRIIRRSHTAFVLVVLLLLATAQQAASQSGRLFAVIGVGSEIAPVEAKLESAKETRIQGVVFTSGTVGGMRVVTVRSGVGKVNAALAATLLADHFNPSAVIFSGTAGAVATDVSPSDVVIGTAVGYHDFGSATDNAFVRSPTRDPATGQLDPAFFPAGSELLEAARRAALTVTLSRGPLPETSRDPRIKEGLIVTGDAFMASPNRRVELRKDLNASALEMEGAAVAQICKRFGIPILVIRSITDYSDANASQSYQQFMDTASRNAAELALATIRSFSK
jgi:adenosylhomocysteine nucleosidase